MHRNKLRRLNILLTIPEIAYILGGIEDGEQTNYTNMKLHEIIEANENYEKSILIESILPYKNTLYAYYLRQYGCEPFLMVTSVSNAAQYARIEPINEMYEAVDSWVSSMDLESEEESEAEREIIMHYSILFNKL